MKLIFSRIASVGIALVAIHAPLAATAASAKAQDNRIKKFTVQLQRLPNHAASPARVQSLVKKLARLVPKKSTQYYAIGLRKLGVRGRAGDVFALRLRKQLQTVVTRSDLPPAVIRRTILLLRKVERNFTPQPPVSATAQTSPQTLRPLI